MHELGPGATPSTIRAALLPEDRNAFDTAYSAALDTARDELDLAELFDTLEHWRRIAILHSDPDNFRRIVRRTAELRTGQPVAEDEPLSITREKAGL